MVHDWYVEVCRMRKNGGPGVMRLWNGAKMLHEWRVKTGGAIVNPKMYGGLMPPIQWVMVEPIAYRRHPKGHSLEMARLLPFSEGKTAYPNRTFSLHEWPFMIHMAGVSSGCIAVEKSDWREAVTALNRAFRESTFLIEVFENDL